jgi:hypothetical protein
VISPLQRTLPIEHTTNIREKLKPSPRIQPEIMAIYQFQNYALYSKAIEIGTINKQA